MLVRIQGQIDGSSFHHRRHGGIGSELCMESNVCLGLLHFLVNDPVLFRFVNHVAGCAALGAFVGRVYRVDAGHHDSWHADLGDGHQVGMSVNLGAARFAGGVFQIRRRGSVSTHASIANTGEGDAILFSIHDDLEHRITPIEGSIAKTAFAGWFNSAAVV